MEADLPVQWATSVSGLVLSWTWRAFDRLCEHLGRIDLTQPVEQLERDLTRNHYLELQTVFAKETRGFAAFSPVHEWPELETRSPSPARPPAYDLGFVHLDRRRWTWPIEAKVVKTPTALHEYVTEIRAKFESGVAAPLVGEGGMIGYLLSGPTSAFFGALEQRLSCRLSVVAEFSDRPHRSSMHQRTQRPDLRLHHMAMLCALGPSTAQIDPSPAAP